MNSQSFNFVCERIIKNKAYPALARWSAEPYTIEWQQFVNHWPYTVPCELHEHCGLFDMPFKLWSIEQDYPVGSYYTVGLGFFDFKIDYFALMSDQVHCALSNRKLTVLFYYHEGDNPYAIKERLDGLVGAWKLPKDCYRFVSGNTASKNIPGFFYFPDHELLYWRRNIGVSAVAIHTDPRERDFTVLSRTHKWWRATAVADLHRNGLLKNSYWSYNTQVNINDDELDNPIEIDTIQIRDYLKKFVSEGPYSCDTLTHQQHNDHSIIEPCFFNNSYCNIVLETHFDADQSGGTFLTEKTFKAIKHGQPFVIVGPPNSLAALRNLGYRTFDHCIDNSYDLIEDNTQRWQAVLETIKALKQKNLTQWFKLCVQDLEHNQSLFVSTKVHRLNMLLKKLQSI